MPICFSYIIDSQCSQNVGEMRREGSRDSYMGRMYASGSQRREQTRERLECEVWHLRWRESERSGMCVNKHLAFRGF